MTDQKRKNKELRGAYTIFKSLVSFLNVNELSKFRIKIYRHSYVNYFK